MDYAYDRPESRHKDLIFAPRGKVSTAIRESRQGLIENFYDDKDKPKIDTLLCRACGWTARHELHSSYDPRIKIFHSRRNIGLWAIGNRWVIRDSPNDDTFGNDYITQQFIRSQHLEIPLLKEMRLLSDPADQVHFILMSQAQGERLDLLWPTLTREQKMNYASQLGEAIKNLRQLHAPTAQKVNGELLDDIVLSLCTSVHAPTCKKIGATDQEWLDNLEPELRHGLAKIYNTRDIRIIDEKLQELRDNFPSSEPYVLTHGDLNLSNIIVKDDKIEAIIDWEVAGFHPWWMEYQSSHQTWPVDFDEQPQDEAFDAMWAIIDPDIRSRYEKIIPHLTAVMEAWRRCQRDHPDFSTAWLRPGFCECRPFAGSWQWPHIGKESGHKIRHFDPTIMPPKH